MDENKRIIEINGVKLEVDLRQARRIDEFKVGDNVKVLDRRYSCHESEIRPGVIVDFANFKELPTLVIAMFKAGSYYENPGIELIDYNAKTENIEIMGTTADELALTGESVLARFDAAIQEQQDKLDLLKMKREIFMKYFAKRNK